MSPKIVVVGSLNMDLIVTAPKIPLEGETITGGTFCSLPGGKGANQAVAASRLGANVHMVGCVGDDEWGRVLLKNLEQENIGTDYVTISPGATGVALITVNQEGNNSIVVAPGANGRMTVEHVRRAESIIRQADLLLIQLEIPMTVVEEAVRLASHYRVPIILNPAPAVPLTEELLQRIDILTPNETEGKLIVTGSAEGDVEVEEIIFNLVEKGVRQVVMTLGGAGVAYSNEGQIKQLKAHKMEVVDTTGAGDSFNAGLGVYYAESGHLADAITFAQDVAALSVTQFGAQASMPSRRQVEQFSSTKPSHGEELVDEIK